MEIDPKDKEQIQTAILALIVAGSCIREECHAGQGYSAYDAVFEDSCLKGEAVMRLLDPEGVAAELDVKAYCRKLYKRLLGGVRVDISGYPEREVISTQKNEA